MSLVIKKLQEIKSQLEKTPISHISVFYRIYDRLEAIVEKYDNNEVHQEKIIALRKRITDSFLGLNNEHIHKLISIIDILIDEIELDHFENKIVSSSNNIPSINIKDSTNSNDLLNKIFIVHGHNDSMKLSVARTLEKLGLRPIILHEQVNYGQTIIEKFVTNAKVGFAIVLLSGDDFGYPKSLTSKKAKLRARQNVIFELGYFTGKIGREKVLALYEKDSGLEIPSDIQGVIYIPFSIESDGWKVDVAKELTKAGFDINANNLL